MLVSRMKPAEKRYRFVWFGIAFGNAIDELEMMG
jgi:hypothetical protein